MKKLKDTRHIPEGTILRVYRPGFGYALLQLIDSSAQYLGALSPGEFFHAVSDGDTIECYYWVEHDAAYECSLKVIGRISKGRHILFLEHSKNIRRRKDRHCLSAQVSLPFRYFFFSSARGEKNFSAEEPVFRDGTITSLSDREIIFMGEEKAARGTVLFGHLELPGSRIDLVGKVSSTDEDGTVTIALTGLPEKDRSKLLDYVFTIYRE